MPACDVVRDGLANYFRAAQGKIHELIAPLSTEQLWVRPYPYGNSIGNLILHLTGNLSYYIGAQMGQTGYVRNRPLEFTDSGKDKAELLAAFDRTIETVVVTIARQTDADWAAPYTAIGTENKNRFTMVLNCLSHADHHVGQIIYLQRELLRKA